VSESVPHDAAAPAFTWPVRIYYEDTDAGGVVYYANYLRFLERARTEWLRALGYDQGMLAKELRVLFVVRAVNIDYLRPSLYDDRLQITVEPAKVGGTSIEFAQRVLRGHEVLAAASVRVVCVDTGSFKPVRLPRTLATKIRTAQ
jgi:acyl-CoA thioester hydrolase